MHVAPRDTGTCTGVLLISFQKEMLRAVHTPNVQPEHEFPNEPLSSIFWVQLRSFPYAASCFDAFNLSESCTARQLMQAGSRCKSGPYAFSSSRLATYLVLLTL